MNQHIIMIEKFCFDASHSMGRGGMAWGGSVVVEPGFRVRGFFLGGGYISVKGPFWFVVFLFHLLNMCYILVNYNFV